MASKQLEELESFDLMSLTVADLASLKSDVLRKALVSAIQAGIDVGASHTNHWAFQSHAQAVTHEVMPQALRAGA